MLRRVFALLVMLSVAAFGMHPIAAAAGHDMNTVAGHAMDHSMDMDHAMDMGCACPDDGAHAPADSDPCAPTLACMIACSALACAVPADLASAPVPAPAQDRLAAETAGPPLTSSYPPFRPPSL